MEKLTPKQRQTIVKIENAFADNPKGLTLEELQHATLVSTNVIVKTLPFIEGLQEVAGVYSLSNAENLQEIPTVEEVIQQVANGDLTADELKKQEAKRQEISHMLDQLKKSASIILTQDNVGTANPAYHVKEKRQIFGIDSAYTDTYVWRGSDSQERYDCDDDMGKALDTIAENLNLDEIEIDHQTFEKVYYIDQERTVTVCFTHNHAQDYIDANRHNLSDPFIYVESFNRNHEMLALRQLLMLLAENPTMLDGILDNA